MTAEFAKGGTALMNRIISRATLAERRNLFKKGSRVELVHMNDPYTILPGCERGYVSHVDSNGTVFVNWDSGITLGCCYETDVLRKLTELEIIKEQAYVIMKTGCTNMMNYVSVLNFAKEYGFHEICDLIEKDSRKYSLLMLNEGLSDVGHEEGIVY